MASFARRQTEIPVMTTSLEDLLRATSRSFYLTLRVLPRAVRPQISLAYLLARTSDTIADAQLLTPDQRLEGLRRFRGRLLGDEASPLAFVEFVRPENTAEQQLLERADE